MCIFIIEFGFFMTERNFYKMFHAKIWKWIELKIENQNVIIFSQHYFLSKLIPRSWKKKWFQSNLKKNNFLLWSIIQQSAENVAYYFNLYNIFCNFYYFAVFCCFRQILSNPVAMIRCDSIFAGSFEEINLRHTRLCHYYCNHKRINLWKCHSCC